MTTSKSLPTRPSLKSLRKQANRLARDVAAGDAGAIARGRISRPKLANGSGMVWSGRQRRLDASFTTATSNV
jgi:hypothetical protein